MVPGSHYSLDWTTGLDYWTGLLDSLIACCSQTAVVWGVVVGSSLAPVRTVHYIYMYYVRTVPLYRYGIYPYPRSGNETIWHAALRPQLIVYTSSWLASFPGTMRGCASHQLVDYQKWCVLYAHHTNSLISHVHTWSADNPSKQKTIIPMFIRYTINAKNQHKRYTKQREHGLKS